MFALIFDSVGAGEWVVLLAVLLVVMGPKRLPSALRTFGQYYAKFRRAAESFKRQIMDMDREIQREVEKVERSVEAAAQAAESQVAEATATVTADAASGTEAGATSAAESAATQTADETKGAGDGDQAS